jgi:hypothetical protein
MSRSEGGGSLCWTGHQQPGRENHIWREKRTPFAGGGVIVRVPPMSSILPSVGVVSHFLA